MKTRPFAFSVAVLALAAALAGCATISGSSPTADPTSNTSDPTATDPTPVEAGELSAGWIAPGSLLGVVTWGSGSCVPITESVEVDGTTVNVTLADEPDKACTMDYRPRVSGVGLPEVAGDADLTVNVTYGDTTTELSVPAMQAELALGDASAGYVGSGMVGLVTYGSSSCAPTVKLVNLADNNIEVVFNDMPADKVCTTDMAPRVLGIEVGENLPAGSTLTFTDGVEQTVTILGLD